MAVDIRKPLKKLLPFLLKAREDNLNEADTVHRIIKVFEEVLAYDPMTEITGEAKVKHKYVDLAIKVDGTIKVLVEAKSAATTLRDRHIQQAENYAAHANVPWVLLTNGVDWQLFHLTFEEGIDYVRVFSLDLAEDPFELAVERLSLLHRQCLKKGALEDFWEKTAALSPASIAEALFLEQTLKLIRRELRRNTGLLIDEEDLARGIHKMLSMETRELIGPSRVRRRKVRRSTKAPRTSAVTDDPEVTNETPGDAPAGEAGSA
jgi:predicted type IV restriction endonuclease